jgi:hypothetical protein
MVEQTGLRQEVGELQGFNAHPTLALTASEFA